jgi:hypothetical protein
MMTVEVRVLNDEAVKCLSAFSPSPRRGPPTLALPRTWLAIRRLVNEEPTASTYEI